MVVVFNEGQTAKSFKLAMNGTSQTIAVEPQAIQTIVIRN